jgi:Ca2+-binding EF-hand superfamily protein
VRERRLLRRCASSHIHNGTQSPIPSHENCSQASTNTTQPPKRKQTAAASASKPATKRRSKLAKENDITAEEEAEIQEAYNIFRVYPDELEDSKDGAIPTADVRRCLIALNAPPKDNAELSELIETVDPDDSGWVDYERFVAIAALKLHARHDDPEALNEEIQRAYALFTKGQDRDIGINDLRRVAKELREDVPENVLKDMIREATGGGLGGVNIEDFEGVMNRAGVFG